MLKNISASLASNDKFDNFLNDSLLTNISLLFFRQNSKSFASDNTYRTHVISKKHKECVLAAEKKQPKTETEENVAPVPKAEVVTTDKD